MQKRVYTLTKAIAEEECLAANRTHGMLTLAIRPCTTFGPGDFLLSARVVNNVRTGRARARTTTTSTYIENLVHAFLLAASRLLQAADAPALPPGDPMRGRGVQHLQRRACPVLGLHVLDGRGVGHARVGEGARQDLALDWLDPGVRDGVGDMDPHLGEEGAGDRHTVKECMAGLKRGWTDGLEVVDREEQLARMLEEDGKFDEPEPDFRQMCLLETMNPSLHLLVFLLQHPTPSFRLRTSELQHHTPNQPTLSLLG